MRLIAFNDSYSTWMPEDDVAKLVSECNAHGKSFMDITDNQDLGTHAIGANPPIPTNPTQQAVVDPLLQKISTDTIRNNIIKMSSYSTRYYTSPVSVESANWLAGLYRLYSIGRTDVTVNFFSHTWAQPSIIVRMEGTGANKNEIVVLGGHIDSISSGSTAPGADDDASGSITVLEAFRVLAESGFKPSRTIEFQGYAAEEVGLRGSQDIANEYAKQGKIIAGMMQLDMTGYYKAGTNPIISLTSDYTSVPLNAFVKKLVETYTTLPPASEACGYACSDHASFYKAGYNACHPFEAAAANENKQIHTTSDVYTRLNFDHVHQFVRLAVGFAVEMSLATN